MDSEYPKFAVHAEQGRRVTMEDMHLILDDCRKDYGEYVKDRRLCYFGVYDGHGGKDAAIWTQKLLHEAVLKDPAFVQGNIEEAIKNGFATADKQLLAQAKEDNFTSGSTVVLGILDTRENQFYIGNVGDSEAVMGRRNDQGGYEPVVLTVKHKPSDQSEKDRIKKAGGHVVFGRVMGTLAVARSLGDRDFKHPFNKGEADFVSAEPYVSKTQITPEDDFLILSCDGLWDKMTYEQAIEMVASLKNSGKTPEETVEILVKDSIEKGSMDNVTAIVIFLNPPRPPKEEKKEEDGEEGEVMDVWEFLKTECERKEKEKETSKMNSKLKIFNLPPEEELIEEFPCALEKKLLYSGTMMLTQNFLCFHSSGSKFKNKMTEQININDIESVEKQKTLLVSNAIKITTKDGKKLFFNWKQNQRSRDQVFSRLLDIIAKLDETPQKIGLSSPKSIPKLPIKEDDRNETSRSAPSTPHQTDSSRESKLTKSEEAPAVLQSGTGRERRGETKAPAFMKNSSESETKNAETEAKSPRTPKEDATSN